MADPDDPRALVGAVLSQRFRLVDVLGQGGLGVVYAAQGLHGEGDRAIKLLRREFCADAAVVQRFLEEAEISLRIAHPGVVRVHEAGRAEDGTPYLVMDRLPGQPLSTLMNRGRMAVDLAVSLTHELLHALAAAHGAGVVHRDLKPSNVLVDEQQPAGARLRVLDFGVARVIDAAGGMARKTHTGALLGTAGYMSPEQIQSAKHADVRADLWSVGVVFYEMLTGALAFEGENDFARITRVLSGQVRPIAQVAPQYAHWDPFFRRALAVAPEGRFQTATEMSEALLAVAQQGQLPGGPFGTADTAVSPGADQPAVSLPRSPPASLVQVLPVHIGVAPRWVAVLVLSALLLGIVIGYLVGAA